MNEGCSATGDGQIGQLLEKLRLENASAEEMGGAEKLRRQQAAGKLNARERIDYLVDPGSFVEYGRLARSFRAVDRDLTPADGKVCGVGQVSSREVGIVSNDFTVKGASSSVTNGQKIMHIRGLAGRYGLPVVYLSESAGARMPDRMGAAGRAILGADPEEYLRIRATPWASALLGPCYGSAAWYAALSDYVVMRRDAVLAVASPRVINGALGSKLEPEELGGWEVQARASGLVDEVADTDEEAIDRVREFLDFLPSHADEPAPVRSSREPAKDEAGLLEVLPEGRATVYDGHRILERVLDGPSILELRRHTGRSLITALARLGGRPVGVICSNPLHKAGAIDVAACKKATRLLTLCDSFNLPVVTFVDTPGFLVGQDGERQGALAHIMNWINALAQFGMPKLSVIMRKSYGQAYLNMGGGANSHEVALWPSADLGFMDARTGASILSNGNAPEGTIESITRDTGPWGLAAAYRAQSVLDPRHTRRWLMESLELHLGSGRQSIGSHRLANWPSVV